MFATSDTEKPSVFGRVLKTIYPDRCLGCGSEVIGASSLCMDCWGQAHFISGAMCKTCAVPVLGDSEDENAICEACNAEPPPWTMGRAVGLYEGPLRRMVLSLKHGDRQDLVPSMAAWMARAGAPFLTGDSLLTPVPLHWRRLLSRRTNQSAVLAKAIAKIAGAHHIPDLLHRHRPTPPQKGLTREQRFDNQRAAIILNHRQAEKVEGRHVVLVDDVMTTGATLFAAAETCLSGGAASVNVLVFARVARPD